MPQKKPTKQEVPNTLREVLSSEIDASLKNLKKRNLINLDIANNQVNTYGYDSKGTQEMTQDINEGISDKLISLNDIKPNPERDQPLRSARQAAKEPVGSFNKPRKERSKSN